MIRMQDAPQRIVEPATPKQETADDIAEQAYRQWKSMQAAGMPRLAAMFRQRFTREIDTAQKREQDTAARKGKG